MSAGGGPRRIGLLDSMFLSLESRNTMMHVAALLRFSPPPDAGPDYLRSLVTAAREATVQPPWNRKLRHPGAYTTPLQEWVVDDAVDLDYHLRRSALPSPGDERELGVLVSRLHSHQLDLNRPPWEIHLIEGLEDGGFAIYVKIHHGLADGYTGMKLIQRGLCGDAGDDTTPMMFAVPPQERRARPENQRTVLGGTIDTVAALGQGIGAGVAAAYQVGSALGHLVTGLGAAEHPVTPFEAPPTILNRGIGPNRRFATQPLSLPVVKTIGQRRGATVNDVSLAVLGGALRRYLSELGELPERSLIAFVPVNVRREADTGGGNAVGAILAMMGTDVADHLARLDAVTASTRAGKAQLEGMSQEAMIAYSLSLLSPLTMQSTLASVNVPSPVPLAFNLIVSNVPGPREVRYFRGSRLEGMYPVSIPLHGVGLNVTFMGYANTLDLGFVGDRDCVPHLQRLAVHTEAVLRELCEQAGADGPDRAAGVMS